MSLRCSFKHCHEVFENESQMKRHKKCSKVHDYCYKCNIDFADDVEKLMHQIQSPRHICCPICGTEFKSNSGRDYHVEVTHPTAQNLPCAGCKKVFDKPSALMGHIEKDECKVIKLEDFQRQRAERQIEKDAFAEMLDPHGGSTIPSRSISGTTWNQNTPTSLLDNQAQQLATDWQGRPLPRPSSDPLRSITNLPFRSAAKVTCDNSAASVNAFPALPLQVRSNGSKQTQANSDDTYAHQNLLDIDDLEQGMGKSCISPNWNGLYSQPKSRRTTEVASHFPKDQPLLDSGSSEIIDTTYGGHSQVPSILEMATNSKIQSIEELSKATSFDLSKFWDDVIQKYLCPGQKCKQEYNTAQDFKAHLLTGAHVGGHVTCPSCLKHFTGSTALIAHCESGSQRCNIRTSINYNQIIREITEGLIGTEGHWEDGSIRYTAPDIQDW